MSNLEEYYKDYKSIHATLLLNGYPMPKNLPQAPTEYCYTKQELEKIYGFLDDDTLKLYKQRLKSKRKTILQIKNGRNKKYKTEEEYYEWELEEFIKMFPEYKYLLL